MLSPSPHKVFTATKSPLEQQFIRDFLASNGYSLEDMADLPEDVSNKLMIEACTFASPKMIEVQTRAQYLQSLSFEEW
jgi:hypothetical protein